MNQATNGPPTTMILFFWEEDFIIESKEWRYSDLLSVYVLKILENALNVYDIVLILYSIRGQKNKAPVCLKALPALLQYL